MSVLNPKRTIYIGNLDDSITVDFLRAAFIPFGDIIQVNLPMDQTVEKHRGFAFIEYEEPEDALAAVDNMQGAELMGKIITCSIANPVSLNARGKPVWQDEEYMKELQEFKIEESTGEIVEEEQEMKKPEENKRIQTTSVIVNAPKKYKTENKETLPPGFVRCKLCGGWGKGLVQSNGYCEHCTRLLEKK
jgi:peptidyl-prolyl isomerase E (cyclophilin E)